MTRAPGEDTARSLVAERFPDAVQAWLGGSVSAGRSTDTSDLDITVLLPDGGHVRRESTRYADWPVELFVHTESSVYHFVAKDLLRRRPTMARLVAESVPLLGPDGGADLRQDCRRVLDAGPPPFTDEELDYRRYALTDLLDDLAGTPPAREAAAVAIDVWRSTAELALGLTRHWCGGGKWLAREVQDLDRQLAGRLDAALRHALSGDTALLVAAADGVLGQCGGRLWDGFALSADLGEA
jgi:predicted nucleotidyltransferase